MNKNIQILKDILSVVRQLYNVDLNDKEIKTTLEYKDLGKMIKYNQDDETIAMALAFEDNAFLGIVTPFGMFYNKVAVPYKKEYIDGLKARAQELFDCVEEPLLSKTFQTFTWHSPQIYPLKKLPLKYDLPPFKVEETVQISEEMIEQILRDWDNYIENLDAYNQRKQEAPTGGFLSNLFKRR